MEANVKIVIRGMLWPLRPVEGAVELGARHCGTEGGLSLHRLGTRGSLVELQHLREPGAYIQR
ncbi:hypothetical protein AAFF_G00064840 [Aldrovandia affinis]|uniref:Uncharacterized protein n=1 Tax=Aldrovandia affinis TaxID=143900 RepID=A0AAD7T5G5_9TELE|nr:hypothetical protein AAFF_G00064840 [Aldrovandia affinis]